MNLFTGEASRELFGQARVPEAIRRLLEQAQLADARGREALLWTARASAPDCLAVYYLLYKFYATRRDLAAAESAARRGLAEAARQAGLDPDWKRVGPGAVDFSQPGPARFWLFTLKALAFVRLRAGARAEARALLDTLKALDPNDSLGAGVVGALADGSAGSFKARRT